MENSISRRNFLQWSAVAAAAAAGLTAFAYRRYA